jgi:hypothetical protein
MNIAGGLETRGIDTELNVDQRAPEVHFGALVEEEAGSVRPSLFQVSEPLRVLCRLFGLSLGLAA